MALSDAFWFACISFFCMKRNQTKGKNATSLPTHPLIRTTGLKTPSGTILGPSSTVKGEVANQPQAFMIVDI